VIGEVGELVELLALHPELVPQIQRAGVGQDGVTFPSIHGLQNFENLDTVGSTGRTGDADDQALLHAA